MSKYLVYAYDNSGTQVSHTREGVRDVQTLRTVSVEARDSLDAAFKAGVVLSKRHPGLYILSHVNHIEDGGITVEFSN